MTQSSHRDYRPAIVSALLAIALYAITLPGTYIYDDVYVAWKDPRLHDVHRWSEYLTKNYMVGAPDRLFRPLTSYSFAIEWFLHGDRPWIMHLLNILLHAAVSAGVAALAYRLAGRRVAYVAGLLFAAHPVHIEGVAYLVGRADTMCTLGILGAILLFLSGRMTIGRAFAIWSCMVFAILSKEPGMLVPPLLLAFVPIRRVLLPPQPEEKKNLQVLLLLLCWSLAGYIVFREESGVFKFSWDRFWIDSTINPLVIASPLHRWLLPFSLLGRYVQLLVFPWRLSIEYSGWTGPVLHWNDPFFYLGIATVIAWWIGLILAIRRRAWGVVSCLLALVISYSIVSNFGILIGANFGERLIYLPSVFFVILAAMLLARLRRNTLIAAMAVLLILASIRTETYAWRWLDPYRLYTISSREQPGAIRLRLLVIDMFRDRRDYEDAARVAAEGRAVHPEYWRIWHYSALVAAESGHPDEAVQYLLHAQDLPRSDLLSTGKLLSEIRSGKYGPYHPPATAPATRPTTAPATTRTAR